MLVLRDRGHRRMVATRRPGVFARDQAVRGKDERSPGPEGWSFAAPDCRADCALQALVMRGEPRESNFVACEPRAEPQCVA